MSFGRNPHVSKAQVAEQKAQDAPDEASRERALREAAHQWDRAATRERSSKIREEYEANAARNRRLADGEAPPPEAEARAERQVAATPVRVVDLRTLN